MKRYRPAFSHSVGFLTTTQHSLLRVCRPEITLFHPYRVSCTSYYQLRRLSPNFLSVPAKISCLALLPQQHPNAAADLVATGLVFQYPTYQQTQHLTEILPFQTIRPGSVPLHCNTTPRTPKTSSRLAGLDRLLAYVGPLFVKVSRTRDPLEPFSCKQRPGLLQAYAEGKSGSLSCRCRLSPRFSRPFSLILDPYFRLKYSGWVDVDLQLKKRTGSFLLPLPGVPLPYHSPPRCLL